MKIAIKILILSFIVGISITNFSCAEKKSEKNSVNDKNTTFSKNEESKKSAEISKSEQEKNDELLKSIEIQKSEEITEKKEPPKPIETLKKAIVMTDKNYLCLLGRDEKMHKITKLGKSSTVNILYIDGVSQKKEIDGKSYFHAVYDNCDYWIDSSTLAFDSVPAIIVENAVVYTDKNLTISTENASLKFGRTVTLAIQEENSENAKMVYYIDSQSGTLKSGWIKEKCVSKRNDDIVVMQIVESLKKTQRATTRNELFNKAAKYKPSAKVAAELEAQKVELIEEDYQKVIDALPNARVKVNVQELLSVDQSIDPFK